MARAVFKYALDVVEWQQLSLPAGAEILTVQLQHGQPYIWALVERTQTQCEPRTFRVLPTGVQELTGANLRYLATVQQEGGLRIWHFFEEVF